MLSSVLFFQFFHLFIYFYIVTFISLVGSLKQQKCVGESSSCDNDMMSLTISFAFWKFTE